MASYRQVEQSRYRRKLGDVIDVDSHDEESSDALESSISGNTKNKSKTSVYNFGENKEDDGTKEASKSSGPLSFFQTPDDLDQEDVVRLYCQSCFLCCLGVAVTIATILFITNYVDFDDDKVIRAIEGGNPGFNRGFTGSKSGAGADGDDESSGRPFDPLDSVIDLLGASSCRDIVETIYWPDKQSPYATILGDTQNEAASNTNPEIDFCGINADSPGLWYAVRGRNTRLNLTMSVLHDHTTDMSGGWENIRLSVVRGTCSGGTPALINTRCVGHRTVAATSGTGPSVEFFGDGGFLYFVYVQGIRRSDKGSFQLVAKRGLNVPFDSDIDGAVENATMGISVAISGDGNYMAASAAFADNLNGPKAGHVRFFERDGNNFIETSAGSLLGPTNGTTFGFNIDLSDDGKTLVVINSNALIIYEAIQGPSATRSWRELFMISTGNEGDYEPGSVAMSGDGRTVAWNVHVKLVSRGYVLVIERNSAASIEGWRIKGQTLEFATFADGNVYDKAVSLSDDGNSLVMAGPEDTARVYTWSISDVENGKWTLRGNHVFADTTSVAMTGPGNCIAAAKAGNIDTRVRVFCFDETDQVRQVGQELTGSTANFGHSLSLSKKGSVLAVGAPWYDVTRSRRDSGRVYVYNYDSVTRLWVQKGVLETGVENDLYGWSVDLASDGSALVIGAPWHRGSDLYRAGMVHVANIFS